DAAKAAELGIGGHPRAGTGCCRVRPAPNAGGAGAESAGAEAEYGDVGIPRQQRELPGASQRSVSWRLARPTRAVAGTVGERSDRDNESRGSGAARDE